MPTEIHYKNKHCALCGKKFTPAGKNAKYCVDCRAEAKRKTSKQWNEDHREEAIHTCDSPENMAKCLNCKKPECPGYCEDIHDSTCLGKKKARANKMEKTAERVAHFVRSGARDEFIMRELNLTKKQLAYRKSVAVKAGLLHG